MLHSRFFLNSAILLSLVMFLLGVLTPFMTVHKFFIVEDSVSILSGLSALWRQQEYPLFFLIGLFSIVFPAAKLLVLFLSVNISKENKRLEYYVGLIVQFGKWSMLDVFVVAVMLVAIKLGGVIEAQLHYGVYAFSISVLLAMASGGLLSSRLKNLATQ